MPLFIPPQIAAPVERFRFMAWGGSGFVPVTDWALPGYMLCVGAEQIRWNVLAGKWPASTTVRLVSSTRGWFSSLVATPAQWFDFLGCKKIDPWKSFYTGVGPQVGAPPSMPSPFAEKYRFVVASSGFAVSPWAPVGGLLCGEIKKLRKSMPKAVLRIVSSTRGPLGQANGTPVQWAGFLNCPAASFLPPAWGLPGDNTCENCV